MTSKFVITCTPLSADIVAFDLTLEPKPEAVDPVSKVKEQCDKMLDELLPKMANGTDTRGMIVKAVDEEGRVLYHNGRVHLGAEGQADN